jgi:hypothetical protein
VILQRDFQIRDRLEAFVLQQVAQHAGNESHLCFVIVDISHREVLILSSYIHAVQVVPIFGIEYSVLGIPGNVTGLSPVTFAVELLFLGAFLRARH